MLASIIHMKLATAVMNTWFAAASPMPVPVPIAALALALDTHAVSPVEVPLYDGNRQIHATVVIERDGSTDAATAKQLTHLFRCRSERKHPLARRTLAMLADLSEHFNGRPIEFVSAYRVTPGEPADSPHRDARAIDFRIRGVKLTTVRDYLWTTFTEVGIGWYPNEEFIHMDSRPTMQDTSWTFASGANQYKPFWAELARREGRVPGQRPPRRRPGV